MAYSSNLRKCNKIIKRNNKFQILIHKVLHKIHQALLQVKIQDKKRKIKEDLKANLRLRRIKKIRIKR